ncbi:phosphatase PAP2 family protein [Rhodococcus sp. NPDC056960]|uniref:phosphatase PAP2 family protein n=1 Tax=Rhodococcus sp. NPDC056960 TaxID=3345982 RepID=UPI003625C5DB
MREVATQLVQARGAGTSVHVRLIAVGRDAVEEVREGDGATVALILLVSCIALFFVASLWLAAARDGRTAGVPRGLRVVASAGAFGALAYQVRMSGLVTTADDPVLSWLADHRSAWLTGPAIAVTDAGGPVGTLVLAVVAGAVLSRRAHSLMPAIILIGTVGAAAAASTVTKSLVGRQRPPVVTQVLLETDHSFPSGHVTGAMALFGMTAVMLGFGLPATRRWALFLLAGGLTVLVAATRLYLGEHWLTDVVGGAVLGGTAVLAGSLVYASWAAGLGRGQRDRGERDVPGSAVSPDRTVGVS